MKKWFTGLFLFLFWGALIVAGLVAYEAHRFLTTPGSTEPREIVISIAPGATFDRVAWDLKKAGAISDVDRFRLLAYAKNSLGRVRAGEFQVNTGWTPEEVLRQITEGQSVLYRLSVREGLTWWDTARAVEAQGFATYEDFKAVIHDPAFLREHAIPFADAEGFLFPDTYLLQKPRSPLDREQARIVASTMVRTFWKKAEPVWRSLPAKDSQGHNQDASPQETPQAAPGNPLSPIVSMAQSPAPASPALEQRPAASAGAALPIAGSSSAALSPVAARSANASQAAPLVDNPALTGTPPSGPATPADIDPAALRRLVILASLVEKETGVPSERARVAGVYANRLRLGMLLQCDPTIIYGVGESFNGAIRRSQIDDPRNRYNTYQHPGLPPGPIASPGLEALQAAALPERHDFLYFVATGVDGGHTFSKSLADHNKAVQVYRSRTKGR